MSRDPYGPSNLSTGGGGNRSPRSSRRLGELPTVDRSPSRSYPSRGSPIGRKGRPSRSGNNSPEQHGYGHHMNSPYYREEELGSPVMMEERGRSMGGSHHRSRSATRPPAGQAMSVRYQSLDRGGIMDSGHDREFMPIREPRERSLDRGGLRDRTYLEDDLYTSRSRQSPNPHHMSGRDASFIGELQYQNSDLQRELSNLKKELELTNQKLGSSMHSIKTFWSPELKKERALRKEESAKYSLINDQLKLLNSENQKQAMLVRQLEEELRLRMRNPSIEMQAQMDALFAENEHLTREVAILRETIRELELRIETQKQTLQARDESIKKLLEMLQTKGIGKEEERQMFQHMQTMAQKQLDDFRAEIQRRDQEILAMSAKMKTLEEQHQDYQRHIAVLKESLCAKEEHYNMMQADELQQSEAELQREKEEVRRLKDEQRRLAQNSERGAKEALEAREREIVKLQQQVQARMKDCEKEKQRADMLEKRLQETGSRGDLELEQWRKVVENEQARADASEKLSFDLQKKVQALEKQLQEQVQQQQQLRQQLNNQQQQMNAQQQQMNAQQQQMQQAQQQGAGPAANQEIQRLRKELEKAQAEAKNGAVERERFQAQLEMLVQELEKNQMELFEANKKLQAAGNQRGPPPGAEQEMNNLRRQLDEARRQMDQQKSQFEEYRKQVDNRARQLDERDKSLANVDQQLKKRKEQLDQLESQLRKGPAPSQGGVDPAEVDKLVNDLAQAQENAKRSQEEMDRLLKLVQMSQEEQNAKEKQIHDLQTALKNAQAKIKQQQQQQQAQQDEQCETDGGKPTLETVELLKELSMKESRITYLENDVAELEQALTERGSMAELEELVDVVKMKNDRIEELEEALRESVRITADRENILQEEQMNRKHIIEKVGKLEQRLLSLQNAHALRCSICRPLVTRFKKMEKRLVQVLSERRKQLQDLARMKREALEAAISEKDAHLGLLELSGIRTARQADEYEQLRSDRKRLMERLKEENERSIELIHEFSEDFDFLTPPIVDFDDEEEDNDERDHSNSTDASRSSENSTSDDGEGL